jgi:hypothetical protein
MSAPTKPHLRPEAVPKESIEEKRHQVQSRYRRLPAFSRRQREGAYTGPIRNIPDNILTACLEGLCGGGHRI